MSLTAEYGFNLAESKGLAYLHKMVRFEQVRNE
jgi:hypothetical protein